MWSSIRRSLIAGVLVLAPLGLTIWVFVTLVSWADKLILLLPDAVQPQKLLGFPVPGLGIVLSVAVLLLVGTAMRYYTGRRIVLLYEGLLQHLPIVSSLYSGLKQLLQTFFSRRKSQFSQAVMVEYPRKGLYSIAFVTNECISITDQPQFISLFLPTTPNPTSGFFLMVERKDVRFLDIGIEEAFKMIMSAGLVAPQQIGLMAASVQELEFGQRGEGLVSNDNVIDHGNAE